MSTKVQKYLYLVLFSAFILFFLASTAFAQEVSPISSPKNIVNPQETFIQEAPHKDFFVAGNKVTINDEIVENLFAIGNEVNLEKKARQDFFVIAEKINVRQPVKYNLFAIGQDVQLDGNIGEDAYIVADRVLIKGNIGDDINITANSVYIDQTSTIGGDININGKLVKVSNNSIVKGSVNINGSDKLESYTSNDIPVDLTVAPKSPQISNFSFSGVLFLLAMMVGDALLATVLFKYFSKKMRGIVDLMKLEKDEIIENLKVGGKFLGIYILGFLVLLFSVIGWPILAASFVLLSVMGYLSEASYTYILGDKLVGKYLKSDNVFVKALVGYAVISLVFGILSFIPYIGGLFAGLLALVLVAWSYGALVRKHKNCEKVDEKGN